MGLGGRACGPAPAVVPAAGRQQQRATRGMAGRCRSAGTLQVRPCKLGSRIHAADTPHSDTAPPLTDFCDLVDPRRAWMNFCQISKSIWGRIRFPAENGSDPMPFRQLARICRRRGGSGCGGVSRMGARHARAGWAGRPTPVLPCAQDSAHEQAATELTGTYLQRPPQPDSPRHPLGSPPLLLLRLLLLLPASGRHYRRCRAAGPADPP